MAEKLDEKLLKTLGDPTRIKILKILCNGHYDLDTLTNLIKKHKSTTYRHLRKLEDAGLVERYSYNNKVFFKLSEFGNKIVSEGIPEIKIELKTSSIFHKIILYSIPLLISLIGIIPAFSVKGVHFISRILWSSIFIIVAYFIYKILKPFN